MLYLFIGIPLAAAFLSAMMGARYKRSPELFCLAAATALGALSFGQLQRAMHGAPGLSGGSVLGIELHLDSFSAVMLLLANAVGLVAVIYSSGYMKKYTDRWKYYCLMMTMICGVNGALLTRDMFNLYVYMEMAAISIYGLVAFGTEKESFEASFKYAVMGILASALIFLGIALIYGRTSSLNMQDIASFVSANGLSRAGFLACALFVVGFGLKAALVPFHSWLPDAYSMSPATVPALSSGILIKVLGVYALSRILFCVMCAADTFSPVLIGLGVLSMSVGALLAFGQANIRRLLGYSSISQIGYIALGLGIGTPLAVFGSILHAVNHSAAKSLLFLSAGSAEETFGTADMSRMSGLAGKSRIAAYSGMFGALSVCGVPPFAGFWSKLVIIAACVLSGRPVLGLFAAIISIMTLAYYFRALTPVMFGARDGGRAGGGIALSMKVALVALSLVVLLGGLMIMPNMGGKVMNSAVACLLSPGVAK